MGIMQRVVHFFSGDMAYEQPAAPVRGYDSPALAAPDILRFYSTSVEGTGTQCGEMHRFAPYLYNAQPVLVLADQYGTGTQNSNMGLAGNLIAGLFGAPK